MNPQILEIILFAALAAFLVLRLKKVLGTRTGNEDPPDTSAPRWPDRGTRETPSDSGAIPSPKPRDTHDQSRRKTAAGATAPDDVRVEESERTALQAIQQVEPNFRVDTFIQGAKQAYEWIILDYENGEKDRLRTMLSPETFAEFEKVMDERREQGLTVEARFVGFRDVAVEKIEFDPQTQRAELAVHFVVDIITAVRNQQGEVVEGDPRTIRRQTNHWVFERKIGSGDPNWLLVET